MSAASTPALSGGLQDVSDEWFAQKQALADAGLRLDFEWSQVYQGMVSGGDNLRGLRGDPDPTYGGKLDLLATLDLSKVGFWPGLSVTAQPMYNYGTFLNGYGGALTPIYDGAIYPGSEGDDRFDLMSLYFTQRFGDDVSLTVGKINLMEAARGYPIRGGGGIDNFWNVNLATTITGLAKPAIFGGMLSMNIEPVTFGLSVFDARDAMNRNVFDDPFAEGVTTMGTATLTTTVGGHTGYYGIRGIYSTEESYDLRNVDYLLLPPGTPNEIQVIEGSWLVSAQFEQYLSGGPGTSSPGWGVFAEAVYVDENTLPFNWSFQAGVGGQGLFPGRPQDRWGIAAFDFAWSDVLINAVSDIGALPAPHEHERGIEVFYNWAVTDAFRITADLQIIDPSYGDETAIFAGIGTNFRF
jgi:porin